MSSFFRRTLLLLVLLLVFTPQLKAVPGPNPIAFGVYYYASGRLAPADSSATQELRQKAGRLPAVFMIYQNWTGSYSSFPWREAKGARLHGKPLLVTWEPWSFRNDDPAWSLERIANGSNDKYVRTYARQAKTFGSPMMIRLAHEMNGDWFPWGTARRADLRRHNGNSPAHFVAMWRRVVTIFRQEGATNVSWVWSPNILFLNQANPHSQQVQDLYNLYPGDAFVDWMGLSIYNDGVARAWRSFDSLFAPAYQTLLQISSKPLMIAELGVTEQGAPSGTSKADWMAQTLQRDIPLRYPRVNMVVWFCRDKTDLGEANYRFDSSPSSLQVFRQAVNSHQYAAQVNLPDPLAPPTRLARVN